MERFKLISSVHLFLISDRRLLLLRRCNTGYEDGSYSVPAGHIEQGEPVTAAALREVREECGIDIAGEDLQVVGVMHRWSDQERIDFFLAATQWKGEISNCEPDKCDDLRWWPIDRFPQNIIPYVKFAWENYRRGLWFSEFGWPS